MKYITYQQNGRGRSGHQLKDIMTVFIISLFIKKIEVIYDKSWSNQMIFENITIKTNVNYNQCLEINNFTDDTIINANSME